jgi:transposase
MSARTALKFSDADRLALSTDRYEHPDPRVQQRMEVLWLISQGETRQRAGVLAGVSRATVGRYVAVFRDGGVAALRRFEWVGPKSDLEAHRPALEVEFGERPPHTTAEACQRIQELTGVTRGETQVRKFLKKSWV